MQLIHYTNLLHSLYNCFALSLCMWCGSSNVCSLDCDTTGMMSPHAGAMGGTPRVNYQQMPAVQQLQYAQQQGMGSGASPASGVTPTQHAAAPVRPGMPQHSSGMTPTPGQGMLLSLTGFSLSHWFSRDALPIGIGSDGSPRSAVQSRATVFLHRSLIFLSVLFTCS